MAYAAWRGVETALIICVACSSIGRAEKLGQPGDILDSIPTPTLGGTQFWTDLHFFHQWRIQRRAGTGECRLLGAHDWQHATGTFEDCLAKLEQVKRERNLQPMRGRAVVLLHGLAAPRWSMHLLGQYLCKQGGYEVFNMEYASTRCSVDDHAQSLASVIRSLEGITEINLIGHSMGNVVIRRYLAGEIEATTGWRPDPRIHRVVLIAPPNHGSIAATRLSENGVFKALFGSSGRQLGVDWKELERRLAVPQVEFGVIAGGLANDHGFNPRLPGDDDGRITVSTTRLAGAADFVVVPMLHELIANDPRVFAYALRFLEDGCFVSLDQRQPIRQASTANRPPIPGM
jgi:pimeloyl-ACP methyl ester carboxylesterase